MHMQTSNTAANDNSKTVTKRELRAILAGCGVAAEVSGCEGRLALAIHSPDDAARIDALLHWDGFTSQSGVTYVRQGYEARDPNA
jgi:hypothetical protein